MAAGDIVGTKKCSRDGGLVTYKESKGGGISGRCDTCGRQTFDRSPKAVDGLKKFLASIGIGDAGGGDKKAAAGEGFDLGKL
jgi:hypothetical protein